MPVYRKRKEPTKTENIEEILDHLEKTGHLKKPLHPSKTEARLQKYYRMLDDASGEEREILLRKIINLITPMIFAIIKQNFSSKYFIGGRVTQIDFFQEAVESILKAIKRRNYKPGKTQLYSFFYLVGRRGILAYVKKNKLHKTSLLEPSDILEFLDEDCSEG